MIPIKDENPTSTFPIFTIGIILVNIASYIIFNLGLSEESFHKFVLQAGVVPARFFKYSDSYEYKTIVFSMFLHANFLHLAGNMIYFWVFGNNIEDKIGHIRFLVFYFLCGSMAAVSQAAMNADSTLPLIGASGAIAGVLGAYFIMFPKIRILMLVPIFFFIELIWMPAAIVLGFWFIFQVLLGYADMLRGSATGGVAWFAHIGGFLTGIVLILFLRKRKK